MGYIAYFGGSFEREREKRSSSSTRKGGSKTTLAKRREFPNVLVGGELEGREGNLDEVKGGGR